jgi:hypothetical protein
VTERTKSSRLGPKSRCLRMLGFSVLIDLN